jgi:hypothetical protein
MSTPAAHSVDAGPRTRAAPADAWLSAEPRLWAELRNVLVRGARRPLLLLAVAIATSALAVAWRARAKPTYAATLTLRMTEGDLQDPGNVPRPPARIREYVSNVALNRERLLAMMEKHGLSARLRQANPVAAVTSMRDDIEIDVVRNYFLFDRETAGESRTALVVLSYKGDDREQALEVVHEIGTIVLDTQAAARSVRLSQAREFGAAQAQRVGEQLGSLQARQARAQLRAAGGAADARVEAASLQQEIVRVAARLRDLQKRSAELELAQEAEELRLGLSFELVDESVRALRERLGGWEIAGYGGVALLLVAPMWAILLGAFDLRVHRAADVTFHRFPLLGVVPHFPGDGAGAYRARFGRGR